MKQNKKPKKKLRWDRLIILIIILIVLIVGMVTIFKWVFIGDGKEVEHKTPLGSYYCRGGVLVKYCWTENQEVYDVYGRG